MIYLPASIATPEVIEAAKKLCPGNEVVVWQVTESLMQMAQGEADAKTEIVWLNKQSDDE